MSKTFSMAFKAGAISFSSMVLLLLLLSRVEIMHGPKGSAPFLIFFQVALFVAVLFWVVSTVILWIEGWLFVLHGLGSRSWLSSVLLLGVSVVLQCVCSVLSPHP